MTDNNIHYQTATLSTGLRVIFLHKDSTVVNCGYMLLAGTRYEAPGEEGLAHFCEHTSFKGTKRRRACHIVNRLDSVGGSLDAYTNKEETCYYAEVLREYTARAIDVLTDMVFHSTYPQRELDKEKDVICDEIDSYQDSPSDLIFDDFESQVFQGSSLGHNILGTAGKVRSYTTADALRFTRKYYQPARAVFYCMGDVPFARVIKMLERAMSDFPAAAPMLLHRVPCPPVPPVSRVPSGPVVMDRNTFQAHVMMGQTTFPIYHPDYHALWLLSNYVGGWSMNSRLNLALREHRGLVYDVETGINVYQDTGQWNIYFGCDHEDVPRCLRLVRRELNRLMDQPLTPRQLAAVKKQYISKIKMTQPGTEENMQSMAKQYLHLDIVWDDRISCQKTAAVTSQKLQQLAQWLFDEKRLTLIMYSKN